MSVDLNFWRYQKGAFLKDEDAYQKACCDHEWVEGLELLPIEDILNETAKVFCQWTSLDPFHYEGKERGSFQISTTPQTVRFDCYSMEKAEMKRFSSVLSQFGCPLYDPQQGARFDKLAVFLIDEAGQYQEEIEQELSRLLPRLELETRAATWDESVRLAELCGHIQYHAAIHRAKTLTKATSFLRFGRGWANRSCQCKTALLAEGEERRILAELLRTSIQRVAGDFLERTYYE